MRLISKRLIKLWKVSKKKLNVFTRMNVDCFWMMKLHPPEMQCMSRQNLLKEN